MDAFIDAREALVRATHALEKGRFDAHSPEGVQVNALESIAWSLIGILAKQEGVAVPHAEAVRVPEKAKKSVKAVAALATTGKKAHETGAKAEDIVRLREK